MIYKGDGEMAFMYRVKQFFWSLDTRMEREDFEYAERNLSAPQHELFTRLSRQDQKHSIKVAREVEEECVKEGIEPAEMVRVALLHDAGKLNARLNSIDKSLLVLGDKFSGGRIRRLGWRKVDAYFNHGAMGRELLMGMGLSERALYLIENHHNRDIEGDRELDILIRCDSRN
jgi:putative nucleotidyltransferase with HDIG domain